MKAKFLDDVERSHVVFVPTSDLFYARNRILNARKQLRQLRPLLHRKDQPVITELAQHLTAALNNLGGEE